MSGTKHNARRWACESEKDRQGSAMHLIEDLTQGMIVIKDHSSHITRQKYNGSSLYADLEKTENS